MALITAGLYSPIWTARCWGQTINYQNETGKRSNTWAIWVCSAS
jgi:hypothetical protein